MDISGLLFRAGMIHGIEPVQAIAEVGLLFGLLTLAAYWSERRGRPLNKLLQASVALATIILYFQWRVSPPIPFSMLATIYVVSCVAIWGWVSSNETYWQDFRRPILAVLDGNTRSTRIMRALAVVAIPLAVGVLTYSVIRPLGPDEGAPIELRVYHAAPPQSFVVYSPSDFKQ